METRPTTQNTPVKNTVNYIWMGNFENDRKYTGEQRKLLCKTGPICIANYSPETEINMWVPESLIKETENLFKDHPSIRIFSVERMLNGGYGILEHITNEIPQIKKALDKMEKTNSFAAQKDLVSLIIMVEYGGYFFDTTTAFKQQPNLTPIKDIKVTLNIGWYKTLEKLSQDSDPAASIWQQPKMGFDIWAFASSVGNPVFSKTLNLCLNKIMNNDWEDIETDFVCRALLNVLEETYGKIPSKEKMKELIWSTEYDLDKSGFSFMEVYELNMFKFHSGSWRSNTNSFYRDKQLNGLINHLREVISSSQTAAQSKITHDENIQRGKI